MSAPPRQDPSLNKKSRLDYRAIICLALSVLVGWLGWIAHLPLSWLLAPLLVTAIFSIAGVGVFAPVQGRRFGQLLIGASVGLQLTAPVLASILGWFPVMAVTALGGVLIASFLSSGFARVENLDRKTAFLATIPGGLSEMANIAVKVGAGPEPVVVTQTFRVALVVFIVPPLLYFFADDVDFAAWTDAASISYEWIPVVIATGALGAFILSKVKFQNPWMIGSLLAVATVAATGIVDGRMPPLLVIVAQVLLGIAIGARFKGDILHRLAHLSVTGALFTVLLTVIIAGFVGLVAAISGLNFSNVMLGAAPGGFAEMVITAQVLHLNVALVAGFHIMRSLLINGFAVSLFTLLERLHFFSVSDRMFARIIRK